MTQKQITKTFSNGNFELTFPYLAGNVQWTVVGKNYFNGKKTVMDNCGPVAHYFKSVTTNFKTVDVMANKNRIAINGTAEFMRSSKRVNIVSACDVYEFNDNNVLQTITSCCIAIPPVS